MTKTKVYRPYEYCAVCGCDLYMKRQYYPYGFTEMPYCEKHAKEVVRRGEERRRYARRSAWHIIDMYEQGKRVAKIAEAYMISESAVREIIRGGK